MAFTNYILMNKNHPVAEIRYDLDGHQAVAVKESFDLAYAPPGALTVDKKMTIYSFNSWWSSRAIPASRNQLRSLMERLRLGSTMELAERCFGLSLSDCYWLNNPAEPQEWKNINFFENGFSNDLGFLTMGQHSPGGLDLFSPNGTLNGNLQKKWKIVNGQRILLKAGSGRTSDEVWNELIASKLHERILDSQDYVPYFLVKEDRKTYCACPNMLGKDEELVPAYDIIRSRRQKQGVDDYHHLLDCYRDLGLLHPEISLSKMFVSDFIMANCDRHWQNFGVIRNVETLSYTRIAPIFDCGNSLWCWETSLDSPESYEYYARPFDLDSLTPMDQLRLFTDLSWLDTGRLSGFSEDLQNILRSSGIMTEHRIQQIISGLERNIEALCTYAASLVK
ncbi:MAG: hypothetical protein LUF35_13625 [Lachnospiraceae bacterium]|nr:hypothetical protein [Lachnospiraceae bacterium]